MKKYSVLILPAMNKVYYQASMELAQAELQVLNLQVLGGTIQNLKKENIGGKPYITFETTTLTEEGIRYISNLSSIYALFEVRGEFLYPLVISPKEYFEDDLISIQKYSGKTNEYFTKLMLNVVLFSSDFNRNLEDKLNILDPMCGKGTSLQQSLIYGYNAYGVEIDRKAFEAYQVFIETYMKEKRMKHKILKERIRENKKVQGYRFELQVANDKEKYRSGDLLTLKVVNEDTKNISKYFNKEVFHALIVDLPYGVQHGSHSYSGSFTRNPKELLRSALPEWKKTLKKGAALGIAWNANVLSRKQLVETVEESGLEVLISEPYMQFEHRVDQAVIRDFVIAKKN